MTRAWGAAALVFAPRSLLVGNAAAHAERDALEHLVHVFENVFRGDAHHADADRLEALVAARGERFVVTLLDCPPSLGPVTVNALVAADRVIVPVQAEYLALEGLVQFLDTVKLLRGELNPTLVLSGLLITMTDERTRLSADVERELRTHFPELVFQTVIPRSVRVAEAPSYGTPLLEHAPGSPGSDAYVELTREVVERG